MNTNPHNHTPKSNRNPSQKSGGCNNYYSKGGLYLEWIFSKHLWVFTNFNLCSQFWINVKTSFLSDEQSYTKCLDNLQQNLDLLWSLKMWRKQCRRCFRYPEDVASGYQLRQEERQELRDFSRNHFPNKAKFSVWVIVPGAFYFPLQSVYFLWTRN